MTNLNLTYDVIFNDENDSNSMGFEMTKSEAIDYIKTWNGTDHTYFGDYKGGVVSVVDSEGEEVYFEEVK